MKKYIVLCAMVLVTSTASARPPLPDDQWTPQAHVWLSRAMVAEAGWKAERDHVAIAYVLARRWHQIRQRWTETRFVDVIRTYCAGLGDYRRSLTSRQKWIRELWPSGMRPSGWPRRASWRNHEGLWRRALQRSNAWSKGELRDPCRGKAAHWGGTIDSPQGRMVPVDCGTTRNTFYGLTER